MAPTVYFAGISPIEVDSDSEDELPHRGQVPTVIVGCGVRDLRIRRRSPMVQHGRANHPRPRRLMAEASRHPTSRDNKGQTLPISIDSNTLCSILINSLSSTEPTSLTIKSMTRSCPSRLVLLKRRKGLLDITMRTVALIRRNQQLQLRLTALQAETRAFVRSVMSNPENRGLQLAKMRSLDEHEGTPDRHDSDNEDTFDN